MVNDGIPMFQAMYQIVNFSDLGPLPCSQPAVTSGEGGKSFRDKYHHWY